MMYTKSEIEDSIKQYIKGNEDNFLHGNPCDSVDENFVELCLKLEKNLANCPEHEHFTRQAEDNERKCLCGSCWLFDSWTYSTNGQNSSKTDTSFSWNSSGYSEVAFDQPLATYVLTATETVWSCRKLRWMIIRAWIMHRFFHDSFDFYEINEEADLLLMADNTAIISDSILKTQVPNSSDDFVYELAKHIIPDAAQNSGDYTSNLVSAFLDITLVSDIPGSLSTLSSLYHDKDYIRSHSSMNLNSTPFHELCTKPQFETFKLCSVFWFLGCALYIEKQEGTCGKTEALQGLDLERIYLLAGYLIQATKLIFSDTRILSLNDSETFLKGFGDVVLKSIMRIISAIFVSFPSITCKIESSPNSPDTNLAYYHDDLFKKILELTEDSISRSSTIGLASDNVRVSCYRVGVISMLTAFLLEGYHAARDKVRNMKLKASIHSVLEDMINSNRICLGIENLYKRFLRYSKNKGLELRKITGYVGCIALLRNLFSYCIEREKDFTLLGAKLHRSGLGGWENKLPNQIHLSDDVFGYVNEQDLFEAILSNSSEIFSRADTYIGIFLLLRDTLSMERKPSFSFAQRSRFSANKISQMIYFIMNLIYTISALDYHLGDSSETSLFKSREFMWNRGFGILKTGISMRDATTEILVQVHALLVKQYCEQLQTWKLIQDNNSQALCTRFFHNSDFARSAFRFIPDLKSVASFHNHIIAVHNSKSEYPCLMAATYL